jgi:very-short-patch-repair endonuclease
MSTRRRQIGHTPVDLAIAELAARQWDQVSAEQLAEFGLSRQAISKRVAAGRLHRTFHGVYSLSPSRLSVKAKWMGAVLACGPGTALSHRDGGAFHGVRPSSRRLIDVTTPRRAGRSRPGIDAHSSRTLADVDVVVIDNIPCTSLARTLLDLATVVDATALLQAIARAEQLRIYDGQAVADVLARVNGHRGAPKLRAVLTHEPPNSENELENRLAALLAKEPGLPPAQRNVVIEDYEMDFAYPDRKLNVETDGMEVHGTPTAARRDRKRDRKLKLAGWDAVRYTWDEVTNEPDRVIAEIRELLRRG